MVPSSSFRILLILRKPRCPRCSSPAEKEFMRSSVRRLTTVYGKKTPLQRAFGQIFPCVPCCQKTFKKRKVVCRRQEKSNSLRMPPFISPESVKELNEVMCVTNDNWTPIPMYCSNCGELLYGYRNDEGKIKYECKRCGTVAVRVQKGRRHDKIDLYAPEGQVRYY